MFYYNIAFDFENKNEFLCYYTTKNRNNNIYSFTQVTTKQELGSFLIEFLNTDFRKSVNVKIKLIEKFKIKLIEFYQFFDAKFCIINISFLKNKEIKMEGVDNL